MKRIRYVTTILIALMCAILFSGAALCVSAELRHEPKTSDIIAAANGGKPDTALIAEFSTYYGDSAPGRKHNVELSVSALNGLTVKRGELLSFNAVVGERTSERGYKEARVILSGEYTEGIGGGVCQVSSTLYNAWALGGLKVEEVHCHTLPSGYVGISRDAAVSEFKDLKLLNDSEADVKISAVADGEDIVIAVYGKPANAKYTILTEIVSEIAPKEIEVIETQGDGDKITYEVKHGRNGYHSRAFLIKAELNGSVTKTQIRDDWYAPTKHKIIKHIPKAIK